MSKILGAGSAYAAAKEMPYCSNMSISANLVVEMVERIAELEEIVKAVAHIGVDFGYGKYELEAGKIDDARTLMEKER